MVGLSVSVTASTWSFVPGSPESLARATKIVRLDADNLAEFSARVFKAAAKLGQRDFGGVHALSGLLKIALSGAATAESRVHVRPKSLMCRDVFLGERNQARIANDVDIGFRRIQRGQLRSFKRARCGGVDARRLPPDFVQRRKTIEQQLPNKNRALRAGDPLAIVQALEGAERIWVAGLLSFSGPA